MTRAEVVEAAQVSIARGSRSFAAASTLFDTPTRARAWLLYSWCRACDDIADGQDHGHGMTPVFDAGARIARLRAASEAALADVPGDDPPFEALRIVVAETGMPHGFVRDHLAGFALDAEGWQPKTEADLLTYCYHVAGVVGCMMAVVMGVDPRDDTTLDRACELGLAFQLANIARDVAEDAGVGRCYLPGDWLAEAGIAPDRLMAREHRDALATLVARLTDRATAFEASARAGTAALGFRSAWAVLAAAQIYGAIGREVARRGANAWETRVSISPAAKIGFIVRAWGQALHRRRYRHAAIDPAWRRPRHPAAA